MKYLIYLSICIAAASAAVQPLGLQPHIEGRITNGKIGKQGEFPYQVGLSISSGIKSFWCGGTLISNRWILTAAHCAFEIDGITVYHGAFDIKNETEKWQQRIYSSKSNIYVHKDYNPKLSMDNDIALIKLPVAIEFNDMIQPATLPKKSKTYSSYEGKLVVASGWGREGDNATSVAQYLRYIEVPVMKQTSCKRFYFGSITDNMICISTAGKKSTCNGDSGGPLVYKEEGINYVIGATSFGILLGCEKGWPGVFCRVTAYLDWIEEISGVSNK